MNARMIHHLGPDLGERPATCQDCAEFDRAFDKWARKNGIRRPGWREQFIIRGRNAGRIPRD